MTPDLEDLLEHVVDQLCEEQAEAVANLPDEEIRKRALLGIQRAQSHGFKQPEAITGYISLMFVVAPDFDEHPAIAKALEDEMPDGVRLKKLFEKTRESDWDAAAANSRGWKSLE